MDGVPYGFKGTVDGTVPNQEININDEIDTGVMLTAQASLNSAAGVISSGTWTVVVEEIPADAGIWQGSTSCSTPPTN